MYAIIRDTGGKNVDKAKSLAQVENIIILGVPLTDEESVNKALIYVFMNEQLFKQF